MCVHRKGATRAFPAGSAEIPAANGHGNARSVARIQSIVANGKAGRAMMLDCRDNSKRFVPVDPDDQLLGHRPPTAGLFVSAQGGGGLHG